MNIDAWLPEYKILLAHFRYLVHIARCPTLVVKYQYNMQLESNIATFPHVYFSGDVGRMRSLAVPYMCKVTLILIVSLEALFRYAKLYITTI